jgi:chromosome segregation ATPase
VARRSESSTATLEPAGRTPEEIAAAAASKSESMRRESSAADWLQWRELVSAIAAGQEPAGRQLAEIASLADRLRLPAGALADAVRAISRDEELKRQLADCRRRLAAADAKAPSIVAEIKAAEARLHELKAELHAGEVAGLSLADVSRSIDEHCRSNPAVFLDVDELVSRSIARHSKEHEAKP